MATKRIIIEFEDELATVMFERSKLTYTIATLYNKSYRFSVNSEVNKDIINIVADSLLAFGDSIKHSLKANLT